MRSPEGNRRRIGSLLFCIVLLFASRSVAALEMSALHGQWSGTWYVDQKFDSNGYSYGSPPYASETVLLTLFPYDSGTQRYGYVSFGTAGYPAGDVVATAIAGESVTLTVDYSGHSGMPSSPAYYARIVVSLSGSSLYGDFDEAVPPPSGWIAFRGPLYLTRTSISVTGKLSRTYLDDQCGQLAGQCTCSTPIQTVPIRYATLQLRECNSCSPFATSTTDGLGNFSFASVPSGKDVYLAVFPETAWAIVYDDAQGGSNIGRAWFLGHLTQSIDVERTVSGDGVSSVNASFHVVDNASRANWYAYERGFPMPKVDVHINAGSSSYDPIFGNIIYLQHELLWHDFVLFHEYGHFVDDNMSPYRGSAGLQNHGPCQTHDDDPEGVFGEGWANYLGFAGSGDLFAIWSGGGLCDIESLSPPCPRTPNDELNIAAVLWDLGDAANESFDTIAANPDKVWQVLDSFQFSKPSIADFMTEYANSSADPIECRYTGVKCPPLGVPGFVDAHAVVPSGIRIDWGTATGASYYDVYRSSATNPAALSYVMSTVSTSMTDYPSESEGAYLYYVRAVDFANQPGGFSAPDLATNVLFTDDPLTFVIFDSRHPETASNEQIIIGWPQFTVKAAHLTELRRAVNAVRRLAGLSNALYSDTVIAGTSVRRVPITELRSALAAARTRLGLPQVIYEDPTIQAGVTPIRANHIQNLRSGAR